MKRKELLRLINKHARIHGKKVTFREGGNHTIYQIGNTKIYVSRHVELSPGESGDSVRKLENEFGKGWEKK
jgi:capsular polysaccharide biosynthesis protein